MPNSTSPTSLLPEPLVIQFHIVAVESLSSHAWPKVKRSRIVRVMGEGSRRISDKTDPAKENESKWDENLRQLGPLSPDDKFTFRVEAQLGSVPLLGRSTTIASTDPYTVDTLLVMQGKQGPNGNIKLPLHSQVKGNEDATLIIKVRKPSSREVGVWATTYAMEVDQQRRLLNGKDRELDVPTTIRE